MAFSEKSFIQSLYCPPTEDDDDGGDFDDDDDDDDAGASRPWSVNNDNRGEANKKRVFLAQFFQHKCVVPKI